MNHFFLNFVVFVIFISSSSLVHSQQPYVRKAITQCDSRDESTSVLGYTCNGETPSCQAYLTFRSQPPLNTVASISALLGADPSQLFQLNSVPQDATFETNKAVLVPVNCSCSGPYYQANASYVIRPDDKFFSIANNTFQGLSTCQTLIVQNNLTTQNLYAGTRINVPLRCACPTKNQSDDGVKYLLSYLVTWGQSVSIISAMFGVDTGKTLQANGLSEQDFNIYPITTLLVPLQNPPLSSQVIEPPPTPQQPTPTPPAPSPHGTSNKTWIYAVVGVLGGFALAAVSGVLIFCLFFRRRKQETETIVTSESFESIENSFDEKPDLEKSQTFWDSMSSIPKTIKVYTYEEIKVATDNFSPGCWIKGSVYRGVINGDFAAIEKKTGDVSEEINLLNKINHFNLIRLSGVSFHDGHWYLVYEFAVKGTVSDWIYGNQGNENFLNWSQRIHIALDVATGLNYLHSYTSPPHVHKDLTCNNVLLDGDFRAKITNFGLARKADEQGGQFALTRHIVGTKGYMAPEYLDNGLVSPKLDVYAFGILMLEILTGKEVAILYEDVKMNLEDILIPLLDEENVKEKLSNFMDPSLQGNYPSELAILLIKLIDSCLKKDPSGRPGMHEIVQSLSTIMNTTISWESKLSLSI